MKRPAARLTPHQIADTLLRARRVAADHAPRVGWCPVCDRPGDCDARSVALVFLGEHDQTIGRR